MKKLRHLYVFLTVVCVFLIIYVNRRSTNRSNAKAFFRLPANASLFKPEYGYSDSHTAANSSYFRSNMHHYYNLVMKGFATSDEEMNEEDELFEDKELENGRCNWKIHSSPIPLELKHRQYARKKLIHDLCDSNGTLGLNGQWQTFEDIPNNELGNLLVDDRHGIIYCYVPKVACTEWKRIMIFLSESLRVNGAPYRHPSDIPRHRIHGNTIQYLNRYSKTVMKEKLQEYKKFIFVREPFVRLISAYRDKFQKDDQGFYRRYGISMLKKFANNPNPPASVKEAHAASIGPSFSNFIQYILSLPVEKYGWLDEHWRQMAHLCHPCQIDYDFIGTMETMEEDAPHMLRLFHVDNLVEFPKSRSGRTDENWKKTWYPSLPIEWRRKLYKLFEIDYKLFGYQVPEDLL